MQLPTVSAPRRIDRLSFSQYQAGLLCLARLAAATAKPRPLIPTTPSSLLGVAFHEVMRRGHSGTLVTSTDQLSAARETFDDVAQGLWNEAHPLIRLKYRELQRLPYYFQKREQAAVLAARLAVTSPKRSAPTQTSPMGAEVWLESRDRLLFGRADYLDAAMQAVIDYKTGMSPAEQLVSPVEQRQLRFYAHLAHESGTPVNKGLIVRADGGSSETAITRGDADAEGVAARAVLTEFRQRVDGGATFDDLATPSSASCKGCEAIAYCDKFWQRAEPTWAEECGTHVEGTVEDVRPVNLQGARLITLKVSRTRGTVGADPVEVEQLPADWMTLGMPANLAGEVVRVVDARAIEARPGVVRADKAGTAVWHARRV